MKTLGVDLYTELDFMDSFSKENPKNYQIWYHRRAIVELMGDASRELAFCEEVFAEDSKNYHAWAHRLFFTPALELLSKMLSGNGCCKLMDCGKKNSSLLRKRLMKISETTQLGIK